jgi:hypothetical protein
MRRPLQDQTSAPGAEQGGQGASAHGQTEACQVQAWLAAGPWGEEVGVPVGPQAAPQQGHPDVPQLQPLVAARRRQPLAQLPLLGLAAEPPPVQGHPLGRRGVLACPAGVDQCLATAQPVRHTPGHRHLPLPLLVPLSRLDVAPPQRRRRRGTVPARRAVGLEQLRSWGASRRRVPTHDSDAWQWAASSTKVASSPAGTACLESCRCRCASSSRRAQAETAQARSRPWFGRLAPPSGRLAWPQVNLRMELASFYPLGNY